MTRGRARGHTKLQTALKPQTWNSKQTAKANRLPAEILEDPGLRYCSICLLPPWSQKSVLRFVAHGMIFVESSFLQSQGKRVVKNVRARRSANSFGIRVGLRAMWTWLLAAKAVHRSFTGRRDKSWQIHLGSRTGFCYQTVCHLVATFSLAWESQSKKALTGLTEMVHMPHGVRRHCAKVISSVAPLLDPMTPLSADSDSAWAFPAQSL